MPICHVGITSSRVKRLLLCPLVCPLVHAVQIEALLLGQTVRYHGVFRSMPGTGAPSLVSSLYSATIDSEGARPLLGA